jgi:small subunit ribosomal protein S17
MQKSVVVAVERQVRTALRQDRARTSKFMAHDEKNEAKVGDTRRDRRDAAAERRKRWVVTRVVEKAKATTQPT